MRGRHTCWEGFPLLRRCGWQGGMQQPRPCQLGMAMTGQPCCGGPAHRPVLCCFQLSPGAPHPCQHSAKLSVMPCCPDGQVMVFMTSDHLRTCAKGQPLRQATQMVSSHARYSTLCSASLLSHAAKPCKMTRDCQPSFPRPKESHDDSAFSKCCGVLLAVALLSARHTMYIVQGGQVHV